MHELGLTQALVDLAVEAAGTHGGTRVTRLVVEIGKLSAVLPDAVRFCFELCSAGTVVEGAVLEILEPPGRATCQTCRAEVTLARPYGVCACGSSDLAWISGDEVTLKEMEVL